MDKLVHKYDKKYRRKYYRTSRRTIRKIKFDQTCKIVFRVLRDTLESLQEIFIPIYSDKFDLERYMRKGGKKPQMIDSHEKLRRDTTWRVLNITHCDPLDFLSAMRSPKHFFYLADVLKLFRRNLVTLFRDVVDICYFPPVTDKDFATYGRIAYNTDPMVIFLTADSERQIELPVYKKKEEQMPYALGLYKFVELITNSPLYLQDFLNDALGLPDPDPPVPSTTREVTTVNHGDEEVDDDDFHSASSVL